jgi:hypothetical protein
MYEKMAVQIKDLGAYSINETPKHGVERIVVVVVCVGKNHS